MLLFAIVNRVCCLSLLQLLCAAVWSWRVFLFCAIACCCLRSFVIVVWCCLLVVLLLLLCVVACCSLLFVGVVVVAAAVVVGCYSMSMLLCVVAVV